ncbi:hypothetical protein FB562_0864 [Homoserinimonas aerilata]|uniref:Uncharacterized protein n=1 Tax=Homoserinimonas aerilata TaxID=1162970 RepID=A0A542YIG8_9MICO|nr:hypothetical protein [Homoserinimonas aerilata]TQL47794.1 hypothetical protein FB562_0864 [Homoserinimonas aerilata]
MPDRPLELPRWTGESTDAAATIALIDRWAGSPQMARIVGAFGGDTSAVASVRTLDYLGEFSAAHWDFRRGRERNLAVSAEFTDAQRAAVLEAAPGLGLAPSWPSRRHYDAVVMTGGMVRAGIVKPRFLRELLDAGVSFDSAVYLGGFRPFAGDELDVAPKLGVVGSDEFHGMEAGMRLAFGLQEPPAVEGEGEPGDTASWVEHSWPARAGAPRLSVLAAPSSEPELRRANTVDTYRFWAEHRRRPECRSVLVITTPIYVPYQAAGAVEVFGADYGLAVETVGVSESANDLGALTQPFLVQHFLQELRSGIRGMASLRARLSGG